jgi:hypothetical protein
MSVEHKELFGEKSQVNKSRATVPLRKSSLRIVHERDLPETDQNCKTQDGCPILSHFGNATIFKIF